MALRVRVCRVDEVVAGEARAFQVQGVTWPVILTTLDGALVAVPGVCPHEDVGLDVGLLVGTTLVCPGHGYGFDLITGRCRHSPDLELRRYKVTLIDDDVWVDLL
jgi:nitrite reductase/ring-hydroxylating ferredoxin subunit